ncbi:MAG: hypothetical protein KDA56_06350 [Hyphomonas sp.]|jgi:anti-sigma regulatory factor (Ser/Thr protein kinase)|nr:hypothetical protein [Hyphomonas sp.]
MADPISLDFKTLDDLALGAGRGALILDSLPPIQAQALGPVVEALSLTPAWQASSLDGFGWLDAGQFIHMVGDVEAGRTSSQVAGAQVGWICWDHMFDKVHWTGFLMRLAAAINTQRFDERVRNGVSAMLGEFRSNIAEHANLREGAVAAYCANSDALEIAIADRGRGVLQSLRENPLYASLADSGHALRLSVSEGVSRHPDPGRGHGFTHLFRGLANRFSYIRLRSGDHALEITRSESGQPMERLSQKAAVPGLLIYSRFDR